MLYIDYTWDGMNTQRARVLPQDGNKKVSIRPPKRKRAAHITLESVRL